MMTLHTITVDQMLNVSPEVRQFGAASQPLIVAMWGNTPTCYVGLIPIEDYVYIWMETLPATADHRLATARHARDLIRRTLEHWPRVVGHCAEESSMRWLRSLGAAFLPHTAPPQFEIRR